MLIRVIAHHILQHFHRVELLKAGKLVQYVTHVIWVRCSHVRSKDRIEPTSMPQVPEYCACHTAWHLLGTHLRSRAVVTESGRSVLVLCPRPALDNADKLTNVFKAQ